MRRVPRLPITRVFADSSGYYALLRTHDDHHREAIDILAYLTEHHARLYTTRYVLAETHALLVKKTPKLSPPEALRLLAALEQDAATRIVPVTAADEAAARQILGRFADQPFSLTDAISFAVATRLRIPYAFTFDRTDFQTYGLTCLTRDLFR
jgi:predicted nucleic acid-binding protein